MREINRGPAERVGDRVCSDRDNAKKKGLLGKAAEVFSFIQVAQFSWADLITGCVGKVSEQLDFSFRYVRGFRAKFLLFQTLEDSQPLSRCGSKWKRGENRARSDSHNSVLVMTCMENIAPNEITCRAPNNDIGREVLPSYHASCSDR